MVGHLVQASDTPPSSPGVLVLPEWWGLNNYIRQRTEDVARLGYIALGVDLYGEGKIADQPDEAALGNVEANAVHRLQHGRFAEHATAQREVDRQVLDLDQGAAAHDVASFRAGTSSGNSAAKWPGATSVIGGTSRS